MQIRLMIEEDLELVRQLWIECGFTLTESDTIAELKRMINHNPDLCFVLKKVEDDSIIGAVLGGFDGRRGWIHHLAIHPQYQKKGLGKKIMNKIIGTFEEKKVLKVKLEVLENNKAVIEFYTNLGWDIRPELTTMSFNLQKNK